MHEPNLPRYPVDDATYDLLVVLSSKLEAMHAYERFAGDPGSHRSLYRRLMDEDARHAELLVDALRERLLAAPTTSRPTSAARGAGDPSTLNGRAGLRDPEDLRSRTEGSSPVGDQPG